MDSDEQSSVEEEIQQLRERAESLEAACSSADSTIQNLRNRLTQEQMKAGELQHGLNAATQREMAAAAEAQRYKREAEHGLQWGSGSGNV